MYPAFTVATQLNPDVVLYPAFTVATQLNPDVVLYPAFTVATQLNTDVVLYPAFTVATQLNLGDLGKLKAQLVSVAAHWVDIADQLNMTLEVDIIKSNHYGVEERLRELLNRWLNREDPSPTLEALCQALRNDRAIIGGANMASKLEEEFKNSGGL